MNTEANTLLSIDAPQTVDRICEYLRDIVKQQNSTGVLLGLSGGIDSAVLAAIAVRALGKERVFASFLFDRDSERASLDKARIVADWLGIVLDVQDISPEMTRRKVYSPLIMKLLPYSARFNRLIQHSYRIINRETPFKTTLKVGSNLPLRPWIKWLMFKFSIRHIEQGFYERHVHRREILEERAIRDKLTLIGAANLSEFKVGWFVKDGIDDLPIQPLAGLYKTQIWQLSSWLQLPEVIHSQHPSPDMMLGITDEFGIGYKYRRLDPVLDMIERGKSDDEILKHGVSREELDDIRELMKYSEWKRASHHEQPPVYGGAGGNVREMKEAA